MPIESDLKFCNPVAYKYINFKILKIINISKICNKNKIISNLNPNMHGRLPIQPLHFILVGFMLLHIILSHAAASSLSLSAPPEVDVSGEGVYEMDFISSDDARSLSALLQVPEGFSHTGNAKIILGGTQSSWEPYQSGQSLHWDLSGALKSCRHIIVNEWEPNPEGTDTAKEWIELYNPTSQAVNIGGWKLVDSYYKKIVSIPIGTVIMPDGYQRLIWTSGSLINTYETYISLLDSAGRLVDRTSSVKDSKNNNLCWARYPSGKDMDSDLDWKFQLATAGRSNGGSSADIYAGESLVCSSISQPVAALPNRHSYRRRFSPRQAKLPRRHFP